MNEKDEIERELAFRIGDWIERNLINILAFIALVVIAISMI